MNSILWNLNWRIASLAIAIGIITALSMGMPRPAKATAMSTVSATAQLGVDVGSNGGVEILGFINDDGQNPLTTFAFQDPDGMPGSSVLTNGAVTFKTGNQVSFETISKAVAAGAPEPLIEVDFALTTLEAGFLLSNTTTADRSASVSVAWSWDVALAADDPVLDFAVGQVFLNLLIDGVMSERLVAVSIDSPPGQSVLNGQFSTSLLFGAGETHTISLSVSSVANSQSMIPAVIPEPDSLYLVILGAGCLAAMMKTLVRRNQPV